MFELKSDNYLLKDAEAHVITDKTFKSSHEVNFSLNKPTNTVTKNRLFSKNPTSHHKIHLKNVNIFGEVDINIANRLSKKSSNYYLDGLTIFKENNGIKKSSITLDYGKQRSDFPHIAAQKKGKSINVFFESDTLFGFADNISLYNFIILDDEHYKVFQSGNSFGFSRSLSKKNGFHEGAVTLGFSDGTVEAFSYGKTFSAWYQDSDDAFQRLYKDMENYFELLNLEDSLKLLLLQNLSNSMNSFILRYSSDKTFKLVQESKTLRKLYLLNNVKNFNDSTQNHLSQEPLEQASQGFLANQALLEKDNPLVENVCKNVSKNNVPVNLIERAISEFKAYQTDLVQMMSLPILSQLSDEKVKAFNLLCIKSENNIPLNIGSDEFYNEWIALKNYAELKKLSDYDEKQKKRLKDAKTMFDKAINDKSTEHEKRASIQGIQKELEGLLPLNDGVIVWLKQQTGLKEILV